MILDRLHVRDFRNLEDVVLTPAPTFNVLFGANGQGKTSMLEAIHFVSEGRSFRSSQRADLMRRGSNRLVVDAEVRSRIGTVDHLGASLSGSEKQLRINERTVPSLESYLGSLRVVVHSPDDSQLIAGPPELRRRFLNRILVLGKPGFFQVLARYVRALKNRNRCLLEHRPQNEVESWSEVLIRAGAKILASRVQLVSLLEPHVLAAVRRITANAMAISLRYRTSGPLLEGPLDEPDAERWLVAQAERRAAQEQRLERTLFGPHLDDLEIQLEPGPARRHASQGERRSLLVALRLAERSVIAEQSGDDPVFLLDDLSSELDSKRAARLVEAVAEVPGQVFLTSTERRAGPAHARSFHVRCGEVFPDPPVAADPVASHSSQALVPPAGRMLS